MTITIPENIANKLRQEAEGLNKTVEERVLELLDSRFPPGDNFDKNLINQALVNIKLLISKIPCIGTIGSSKINEPFWWLKFSIDIHSEIAWNVIQELAHILNYLSVEEKLPTLFYPVSPPPYLNGGPEDFLSWVIESSIPFGDTNIIYDYLQGRLPQDPDKEDSWSP